MRRRWKSACGAPSNHLEPAGGSASSVRRYNLFEGTSTGEDVGERRMITISFGFDRLDGLLSAGRGIAGTVGTLATYPIGRSNTTTTNTKKGMEIQR